MHGIVISRETYNDDFAGIVFAGADNPIYVMRKCSFAVPKEELEKMSRTKREKAGIIPDIGEQFEFEADSNNVITKVRKADYKLYDFDRLTGRPDFTMIVHAVMSTKKDKELRCVEFGRLETRFSDLTRVLPNVPYEAFVKMVVVYPDNWKAIECINYNTFRPSLRIAFAGIHQPVKLNDPTNHLIRSMPWNKELVTRLVHLPFDNDGQMEMGLALIEDVEPGKSSLSNRFIQCMMVDMCNAFCVRYPKKKFKLAFIGNAHHSFSPGAVIFNCRTYKCSYNDCHIIYEYAPNTQPVFPTEKDNDMCYYPSRVLNDNTYMYLLPVTPVSNIPRCYTNSHTGHINDPQELLGPKMANWHRQQFKELVKQRVKGGDQKKAVPTYNAWVYYSPSADETAQFAIHKLE